MSREERKREAWEAATLAIYKRAKAGDSAARVALVAAAVEAFSCKKHGPVSPTEVEKAVAFSLEPNHGPYGIIGAFGRCGRCAHEAWLRSMRRRGRKGGLSRSEAKAEAARANGAKGGRPKRAGRQKPKR